MNRMLQSVVLAAALVAGSAVGLPAQERVIQTPPALEQNDPRGPVVSGLSTAILAGDRSAAETYLLAHAARGYDRARAKAQLGDVFEKLKGEFVVPALRQGPEGEVLVPLWRKGEQRPSFILVVRVEPTAPHRITGVQLAPALIRGG